MKFIELKKQLNSEQLQSVYLIKGNDVFLRDSAKKQLINACNVQNSEFNISVFEENSNPGEVLACLYGFPLMSDKKVVIYNIGKKSKLTSISGYIENPMPSSLLILMDNGAEFKSKSVVSIDCNSESETNVELWCIQIARKNNLQISLQAVQLLCRFCAYNMARITSELDKLSLIYDGEITSADIEKNVYKEVDYQIYEIANSLAKSDGHASQILEEIIKKQSISVLPVIINALFSNYKRMYATKTSAKSDDELAQLLQVRAYAITQARKTARKLTLDKIIANLQQIETLDFALKSGKITPDNALKLLVMKLG